MKLKGQTLFELAKYLFPLVLNCFISSGTILNGTRSFTLCPSGEHLRMTKIGAK